MTWRDVQQLLALMVSVAGLIVVAIKIRRRPAAWRKWVPLVFALAVNALYYLAIVVEVLGSLANELSPTRSLVTITMLLVYSLLMPAVETHEH